MLLATLKVHLQGLLGTSYLYQVGLATICYNEAIEACLMNENNWGNVIQLKCFFGNFFWQNMKVYSGQFELINIKLTLHEKWTYNWIKLSFKISTEKQTN